MSALCATLHSEGQRHRGWVSKKVVLIAAARATTTARGTRSTEIAFLQLWHASGGALSERVFNILEHQCRFAYGSAGKRSGSTPDDAKQSQPRSALARECD